MASSSISSSAPQLQQVNNKNLSETVDTTCCIGRVWKWIVDKVCACITTICDLIASIFCCGKKPPPPPTTSTATSTMTTTAEHTVVTQKRSITVKPVEYLDPPETLSDPLENFNEGLWPEGTNICPALKQLLQFLCCSEEFLEGYQTLLVTAVADQEQGETQIVAEEEQKASNLAKNRQHMQNHLSAVVEKMRNPSEEAPLTKDHLGDLQRAIFSCTKLQQNRCNTHTLYFKLCEILNCRDLLQQFDPVNSLLTKIVNPCEILRKPEVMAAPIQLTDQNIIPIASSSNSQSQFNQFLVLLTASPIADEWLATEIEYTAPPATSKATEMVKIIREKNAELARQARVNLQSHLACIIDRLRNPTEENPLTSDHIRQLQNLLNSCGGNSKASAKELLKFFCTLFKGNADQFSELHRRQLTLLMQGGLMPMPQSLSDAAAIESTELPEIENEDPRKLAVLYETLAIVANSKEWNTILHPAQPFYPLKRLSNEPESNYLKRTLAAASDETIKNMLQQQLCAIIHALRTSSQPEAVNIQGLLRLLEAAQCNFQNMPQLIRSLGKMLNASQKILWSGIVSTVWEEVKGLVHVDHEELPLASESHVSRPLHNLGATCYLNSSLQMIAQLNCFNEMLTTELVQEPSESVESLERRKALQSHLRAIIATMRQGEPGPNARITPISSDTLSILFKLLQVNGWYTTSGSQEDPQEFFLFLRQQLGASNSSLRVMEKYSYEKNEEPKSKIVNGLTAYELSVPLPLESDGKLSTAYDTIDKLIENYSHERIPESEGYCPEEDGISYNVDKDVYLVGDAPETLFIHLRRFRFDGITSHRIQGKVPVSPTLTLPVYDSDDLTQQPVNHTYALKTVVGHIGSSANSGHYVAYASQKNENSEDSWVLYNDSQQPKWNDSTPQTLERLSNEIGQKAYYLAYVRVD